jgi:pPIWI_RE three-gene island domain Y/REase associating with pPIWI_RE
MVAFVETTANVARPVPWRDDWGEIVLRLLASGVVDLAEHITSGQPVRLPYPVSLQRALDRLSVMCIAGGSNPPRSVADLLRWCQRPLDEWKVPLAVDEADHGTRLIVGGQPSRECLEWAIAASDVEGEFRERRVVYEALDVCRANDRPDVYVAFRELLIAKPAMSELDLATELARPGLSLVASQVQQAYESAPPEALASGRAIACGRCGNLLLPGFRGELQCAEADCTKATLPGRAFPAAEGVRWAGREIRTWISAPGRAELRIRDRLAADGVEVGLWPEFDGADLEIIFSDGKRWWADVKTWASPVQLALRLKRRPFLPGDNIERAFIVVGKDQVAGRREYMQTLRNRNPALKSGSVRAVAESAFVSMVLRRQKGYDGA